MVLAQDPSRLLSNFMFNSKNSVASTATKAKQVRIQFNGDTEAADQAFGKCKTLFMVESYHHLLSLDEELSDDYLDKMENECEQLAIRATRDNRSSAPEEESNEWANHIFDKQESKPSQDNPATDSQRNLLRKLIYQKISDQEEKNDWLAGLEDLDKKSASEKIKELINL